MQSFKACIYKTEDVPEIWDNPEAILPGAIHCFPCAHRVHFDHDKNTYYRASKISSFCEDGL